MMKYLIVMDPKEEIALEYENLITLIPDHKKMVYYWIDKKQCKNLKYIDNIVRDLMSIDEMCTLLFVKPNPLLLMTCVKKINRNSSKIFDVMLYNKYIRLHQIIDSNGKVVVSIWR